MSRLIVSVFTFVCLMGLVAPFAAAQGPIRNLTREMQLQRADYPGPIAYAPTDQDTRSKRLRMQTGHYGLFYNCDDEECKRNSPYICWNSQHKADWYGGWKNAWRKDRNDIVQRLLDGGCADCGGDDYTGEVFETAPMQYSNNSPAPRGLLQSLKTPQRQPQQSNPQQTVQSNRLPVINAASLGRPQSPEAGPIPEPRQAERRGIFRRR